tara:strand:+ start:180 stop:398 length:219 start_codon:yes stop_codon:yes gene_type:complete
MKRLALALPISSDEERIWARDYGKFFFCRRILLSNKDAQDLLIRQAGWLLNKSASSLSMWLGLAQREPQQKS